MPQAFANLIANLETVSAALESTATRAEQSAVRITEASKQVATSASSTRRESEQIVSDSDRLRRRLKDFHEEGATLIDDLQDRLKTSRNIWDEEVNLHLELLEVGGITLQEFLRKLGDSVTITEEGTKEINELLKGLNPRQITKEIRELTNELSRNKAGLEDVIDFLERKGGRFADTVKGWLKQLENNEITLGRLRELIQGLEKEFPGSDFSKLLNELEEDLLRDQV